MLQKQFLSNLMVWEERVRCNLHCVRGVALSPHSICRRRIRAPIDGREAGCCSSGNTPHEPQAELDAPLSQGLGQRSQTQAAFGAGVQVCIWRRAAERVDNDLPIFLGPALKAEMRQGFAGDNRARFALPRTSSKNRIL